MPAHVCTHTSTACTCGSDIFPYSLTPTCADPDIGEKGVLKNLDKYTNQGWKEKAGACHVPARRLLSVCSRVLCLASMPLQPRRLMSATHVQVSRSPPPPSPRPPLRLPGMNR